MSKVKIQGNASGTGVVTLTAPNTNTDRTITLPDSSDTLVSTAPSTSGNILTSDGTNWTSAAPAAGGADTSLSNLTSTGENKVAQAWVNFNGTGTVAIRDSHNISSITDNATGNYTVNFSNSLGNADYTAGMDGLQAGTTRGVLVGNLNDSSKTASLFSLLTCSDFTTTRDASDVYIQVFGD
jgi:hypothetical protein